MRVFVTGASGFIGSAVVAELIGAGHHAVGLARSDDSAAAISADGAEVHRGALDDLDGLRRAAAASDGVIHLAFSNDFSNFAAAAAAELLAIEAIGGELEGSGKPFVVTSGTLLLSLAQLGRHTTEDDVSNSALPRVASENTAIALAERGVRSSVVRLAPCVHNPDRQGLASRLTDIAREKGLSAYIGDGSNRWPAVHRLDAARLFRLALEEAPAGSRLHAVGEEGIPFREIAEAIGRRLDLPISAISQEEAAGHFGDIAFSVSLDNPTSSALTRERLRWQPAHRGLIEDLAEAT
jgi:nucleoside-diphosphate-sugar epimerase